MTSLIFIGDRFYMESGTVMSPLYEEMTWTRYDWGFVNRDLRNGIPITIRPATSHEMEHAEKMLVECKSKICRRPSNRPNHTAKRKPNKV